MIEYKLSDEVISTIAKQLQMAILTGTDIIDNLRVVRVVESENTEGSLVLSPEYREISENQINKLMEQVSDLNSQGG
tara:strand:+ start:896 stop:1126 length:231 start_codon:yes stop_codon:yes gene_type:complete